MKVSDLHANALPRTVPPSFWKSPARGRRVTAALGLILLPMLSIVVVTGLLSYAAYNPRLRRQRQRPRRHCAALLPLRLAGHPVLAVPAEPGPARRHRRRARTDRARQALVGPSPALSSGRRSAHLPSCWNAFRSLALVGGILFELVTGLLNISNDYVFGFSFYTAHLYGAVVFIAGFVVHVSLKLRLAYRSVRRREKPADGPDDLVAPEPGPQHHQPARRRCPRRRILARRRRPLRRVRPSADRSGRPRCCRRAVAREARRFPINRTARTARVTTGGRRVAPDARRQPTRVS